MLIVPMLSGTISLRHCRSYCFPRPRSRSTSVIQSCSCQPKIDPLEYLQDFLDHSSYAYAYASTDPQFIIIHHNHCRTYGMDPFFLFEDGNDSNPVNEYDASFYQARAAKSSPPSSPALDPQGDYNLCNLQHRFLPLVKTMRRIGYSLQEAIDAVDFPAFWDKAPVSREFRDWALLLIEESGFPEDSEEEYYLTTSESPVFSRGRFCDSPSEISIPTSSKAKSLNSPLRAPTIYTPPLLSSSASHFQDDLHIWHEWTVWWVGSFPSFRRTGLTYQQVIDNLHYSASGMGHVDLRTMPSGFREWAMDAAWQEGFRYTTTLQSSGCPLSSPSPPSTPCSNDRLLQDWFVNWLPAMRASACSQEDALDWTDVLPCRGLPDKTPKFRAWAEQVIRLAISGPSYRR